MKKIVLLLFLCISGNIVFSQEWYRPIKEDITYAKDSDTITFFKGEYLYVTKENEGNIKLGTKTLATDKLKCTDYSLRDSAKFRYPLTVSYHRTDSNIYINIKKDSSSKSTKFRVIDQINNVVVDSCDKFNEWVPFALDSKSTIIRISPDSNVCTVLNSLGIESGKLDSVFNENQDSVYKAIILGNDTIKLSEWEPNNNTKTSPSSIVIWIVSHLKGIIIVAGIIIVVLIIIFFLYNKKKNNVKGQGGDRKPQKNKKNHGGVNKDKTFSKSKQLEKLESLLNEEKTKVEQLNLKIVDCNNKYKADIDNLNKKIKKQEIQHESKIKELNQKIVDQEDQLKKNEFYNKLVAEEKKSEELNKQVEQINKEKLDKDKKINELNGTIETNKKNYENDLAEKDKQIKASETLLKSREDELNAEITNRDAKIENVEKSLKDFKDDFDKKLKEKEDKIKEKADKKIQELEKERDDYKDKTKKISSELNEKFDKERESMKVAKTKVDKQLEEANSNLMKTKKALVQTQNDLSDSKKEVLLLKDSQKIFTSSLTYVPFAKQYSNKIQNLINTANLLVADAMKMMKYKVEDNYHIVKSIAKYTILISEIDMEAFYSDVNMISKGALVMNSADISKYDQKNDSKLDAKTCQYFFDKYLGKYIEALVVLNESMAGMHKLLDDISADKTKIFEKYRASLEADVSKLGIKVESVKLFDKAGNKIGLDATFVNAQYNKDEIIEIENCRVYIAGDHLDKKIKVKVQQ